MRTQGTRGQAEGGQVATLRIPCGNRVMERREGTSWLRAYGLLSGVAGVAGERGVGRAEQGSPEDRKGQIAVASWTLQVWILF